MALDVIVRRAANIRKALDAVVMVAPESADPVTSITTGATADLVDFATDHADYMSLGRHTKADGLNFGRAVETSDVTSQGAVEPTRRDITSDVVTLQVSLQETQRLTLELAANVDLSAVTPTATTGEIDFNRSSQPQTRFFRVLTLGQDGFGTNRIYFARFFPRAMVSEVGETVWSDTDEIRYQVTFTATVDDTVGYAMREMWGGPWWMENLENMNFPALVP